MWIKAQLALIETNMVSIVEVFLPYLQTGINKTLYDQLSSVNFDTTRQLPPGKISQCDVE